MSDGTFVWWALGALGAFEAWRAVLGAWKEKAGAAVDAYASSSAALSARAKHPDVREETLEEMRRAFGKHAASMRRMVADGVRPWTVRRAVRGMREETEALLAAAEADIADAECARREVPELLESVPCALAALGKAVGIAPQPPCVRKNVARACALRATARDCAAVAACADDWRAARTFLREAAICAETAKRFAVPSEKDSAKDNVNGFCRPGDSEEARSENLCRAMREDECDCALCREEEEKNGRFSKPPEGA